ncbi:helicase C-terminal domain-containing protein [Desulfovirgula thermocuniculi]|uniref:helicase C-terminal domain-containing protein n=1 Tax=Desulfovirgula thermocuniculi TaxID=348842 RepID=UPI00041DB892|nr:helicase C-terminal domain-containing protein [Desulfovirgula thermocuniculi]
MPLSAVICDVETTGLNPQKDEIIEIALLRLENGEITGQFHSLVRPGGPVPPFIRRLTGLDEPALAGAPTLQEILPAVMSFIGSSPLLGHHISFDRDFLQAALGRALPNKLFDTRELARILLPTAPSYKLSNLCRLLGIRQEAPHRALSDTLATASLYRLLLERAAGLGGAVLADLADLLQQASSPWAEEISCLARMPGCAGASAFHRDNAPKEEWPGYPLPPSWEGLPRLLCPGGPLASNLSNYEYRPQQVQMVAAVAQALEEGKFLVLEAGTGTGKTIGYLLPAMYRALTSGEKVVVATRTINLQDQLWRKDIPLLQRALGWPCHVALVKGRQNYLCLQRWYNALHAPTRTKEEAAFLARILVWCQETATGDRAELNLNAREQELWLSLSADGETCEGYSCPFAAQSCYLTRMKKEAEAAHLIITNHSLLLSDLRVESRLLPRYEVLVVDEAHHLEEAATEQMTRAVSRNAFFRWLSGLSHALEKLSRWTPEKEPEAWHNSLRDARKATRHLLQQGELFFSALHRLVMQKAAPAQYEAPYFLRLQPQENVKATLLPQPYGDNFMLSLEETLAVLSALHRHLKEGAFPHGHLPRELSHYIKEGRAMKEELEGIIEGLFENHAYWAEAHEGESHNCLLCAAPVRVDHILHEQLYRTPKAIVFTSATLTVNGSFAYFTERTGLNLLPPERLSFLRLDSPFAYNSQSLLCVVKDLPLPKDKPDEKYYNALVHALDQLAGTVDGRMLVLYTSHRALRETYRRLKPLCEQKDICLLAQSLNGNRWQLVKEFCSAEKAILLGLSSFWEGVDLSEAALSCVVIVKLPFLPPYLPLTGARLEELASQGKDGFHHLSLPQAVIRFRQGFGRLIRTARDRGVIVVLDGRLITKKYGRYFLNSLPLSNHIKGSLPFIAARIFQWLHPGGSHISASTT